MDHLEAMRVCMYSEEVCQCWLPLRYATRESVYMPRVRVCIVQRGFSANTHILPVRTRTAYTRRIRGAYAGVCILYTHC